MKITVYCGSSAGNDEIYMSKAYELGSWIAKSGHELVFGASNTGLMGAVANGALECGGKVIGVVPDVPAIKARMHKGLTDYIFSEDMSARKKKMLDLGDAFIALPGGIGTLDEISEAICLSQLRIHTKPCVFYNINGYYDPIYQCFEKMEDSGFAHLEGNGRVLFSDNLEEIGEYITAVE